MITGFSGTNNISNSTTTYYVYGLNCLQGKLISSGWGPCEVTVTCPFYGVPQKECAERRPKLYMYYFTKQLVIKLMCEN